MRTVKKILLFIALLSLIFFGGKAAGVYAQACADKSNLNDRINCYEDELSRLGAQSKTLSNQIAQFDAQIRLTTLKISQTEEKISLLGGRIDQLEGSLDSLSTAFSSRAVETYKMARVGDPFLIVVSAPDLNEAISRFHYLQRIQEADRDLLQRLQAAQDTYKVEKTDQEELQAELEKQKANLDVQKKAKNALLTQTKNDEKKYQQLLSQALAEKAAIERALVSGVKVGPVKRGDPIALVGNSGYPGCSTGKHLHFEIRKNNTWTDPGSYLSGKTVVDEQNGGGNVSLGSGSWPWPIEDTVRLTQFYGHTPYSWKYTYSGGLHTGYDMVSTSSDVIRAPADGTLFKSSQLCGSSTINIVYIEHGDNVVSLYLHVQ
ncbi:MAG: Peptidase, M23 family [Parcubacteria group bacterium GW2011_GWA1_Parcubacteria_45_10]|nr:MAG: Peptidase, M23 family [Parcubacteria group bacterium GW2011_GWA1_Parcubacteria_45_10]